MNTNLYSLWKFDTSPISYGTLFVPTPDGIVEIQMLEGETVGQARARIGIPTDPNDVFHFESSDEATRDNQPILKIDYIRP